MCQSLLLLWFNNSNLFIYYQFYLKRQGLHKRRACTISKELDHIICSLFKNIETQL